MRRWWWVALLVGVVVLAAGFTWLPWFRGTRAMADPRPVPNGDWEIAWLHNPTSFESWDNFVWGVKRAEMTSEDGPSGLEVDDVAAFPHRTTAVPEVVIRRKGYAGSLRIRWYKVTDEATQEAWVRALAARSPPPLAILGGWSSDRAKELAIAMRDAVWSGPRPLLFLGTATADKVDPDRDNPSGDQGPSLISVYDRSFRFCFTNQQMASAVTDFVLSDPTLRPGRVHWPAQAVPTYAAGPWAGLTAMGIDVLADGPPVPAYAIEWRDDPYSTDLSYRFREALQKRSGPATGHPRLVMELNPVPFTTGRLNRPNPVEAAIAEHVLETLPPPGTRTVLVIPSVSAPTRRFLRALVQGNPAVGRQLVAVTGDGISVNTLFRDREFAWPVRSLPIPIALFTHADPFGWDVPGTGTTPPRGYELELPPPGGVRSSTEDVRLFTRLTRVVATGVFPEGGSAIARSTDAVARTLRSLNPAFFDPAGNRKSETGEHVVVLRPVFLGDVPPGRPHPDATLEVYGHRSGRPGWTQLHAFPLGRGRGAQPE